MKKVIISISLCLIAAFTFAQSKNVTDAQKQVKMGTPDYDEARRLIKLALENAETSNQAKTWYTAGWIESQQFEAINATLLLGTALSPDQQKNMYDAILAMYPYFVKTSELDNVPDEKGKVKPKYKSNIKTALKSAHNYYINGGSVAFDAKDYARAYEFWNIYTSIPNLSVFEGDREMARLKADSSYHQFLFYTGIAASEMKDPQKAIVAYEEVAKTGYNNEEVLRYLSYEYNLIGEKEKYVAIMNLGAERYPNSSYFLLSLINFYISEKDNNKAIQTLEAAVAIHTENSDLFRALGEVYEEQDNREKARENFNKALEINPENIEALGNMGRTYYNDAVKTVAEAADADQATYQRLMNEAKELYRGALPYFEKAVALNPDGRDLLVPLRSIYYNLNMGDKLEEISKKFGE